MYLVHRTYHILMYVCIHSSSTIMVHVRTYLVPRTMYEYYVQGTLYLVALLVRCTMYEYIHSSPTNNKYDVQHRTRTMYDVHTCTICTIAVHRTMYYVHRT